MAIFGRRFDGLTRFDTFFSFTWNDSPLRQSRWSDQTFAFVFDATPLPAFTPRGGLAERAANSFALDSFAGFDDYTPLPPTRDDRPVLPAFESPAVAVAVGEPFAVSDALDQAIDTPFAAEDFELIQMEPQGEWVSANSVYDPLAMVLSISDPSF